MATSKSAGETFCRLGMFEDRAMPTVDRILYPNARRIIEQSNKTFGNRYKAIVTDVSFREDEGGDGLSFCLGETRVGIRQNSGSGICCHEATIMSAFDDAKPRPTPRGATLSPSG